MRTKRLSLSRLHPLAKYFGAEEIWVLSLLVIALTLACTVPSTGWRTNFARFASVAAVVLSSLLFSKYRRRKR